uniref:Uncharacterized protein n=1 Tax=Setaria digitata TaxID=48799 RepID=A0A915PVI8_9BILA
MEQEGDGEVKGEEEDGAGEDGEDEALLTAVVRPEVVMV